MSALTDLLEEWFDWMDEEELARTAALIESAVASDRVDGADYAALVSAKEQAQRVRDFLAQTDVTSPLLDDARALASFVMGLDL